MSIESGAEYPGGISDAEMVKGSRELSDTQRKLSYDRETLIRSDNERDENTAEVQYRKDLEMKAANMAWRAEGLNKVLEAANDSRAKDVERAILEIFIVGVQPTQYMELSKFEDVIQFLEKVCEEYSYDSGKRKFPEAS